MAVTHLLHVKRALTACMLAALFPVLMVAHANAGPVPSPLSTSSQARTYPWTSELAREFPGCQRHVSGVAAAFVVERLDRSFQRMGFDEAWRRGHDKSHADDVWVLGQCQDSLGLGIDTGHDPVR